MNGSYPSEHILSSSKCKHATIGLICPSTILSLLKLETKQLPQTTTNHSSHYHQHMWIFIQIQQKKLSCPTAYNTPHHFLQSDSRPLWHSQQRLSKASITKTSPIRSITLKILLKVQQTDQQIELMQYTHMPLVFTVICWQVDYS